MELTEEEYFAHYGTPRRSGRYPWGSGGDPDQTHSSRNQDFERTVKDLRDQGMKDVDIAKGMGISTTVLRSRMSLAVSERKAALTSQIIRLKEAANSNVAIAQRLGIPESTVRSYLKNYEARKEDILFATTNMLRDEIAKGGFIDIGSGTENYLGISATKLNTAANVLKDEGYQIHDLNVTQVATGQITRYKVLCPPETTRKDVFNNQDKIRVLNVNSDNGGESYDGIQPPLSLSSGRVAVRYKEQGGGTADGVLYVREGVPDVSLGNSRYAQVRVTVDGTHYLKGMATYKADMPEGVDVIFNTNKSDTGNKLDAMKKIESDDPLNPYGATIRNQVFERDANGKKKLTSVMNIVNEEGSWDEWSNTVSTQFLSKQSPVLIKNQLDMTFEARKAEFAELSSLTNPTVKKKLLETFGDETDSAAVHLDAAGFPRQSWHVILPIDKIPPTQIYAPKFNDGETVVLIRYPHGGTFEIPELVVNNQNREARRVLGNNPKDAVGIHHTVAERLSGADFDGDTVLVIPNPIAGNKRIKSTPALEQLKNFDVKDAYAMPPDLPKVPQPWPQKQTQMGMVSNLITDMTIRQAPVADIARAVKHSMVVIDAEKHNLNWKQSEIDNGIKQLRQKYQFEPGNSRGASTLISRATAEKRINERQTRRAERGGPIDPTTGERVFEETGRMRRARDGSLIPATERVAKLSITSDAHTLSTGTPQERLYADHSNRLKALANQARLEAVRTPNLKYRSDAKRVYANEVQSLNDKLDVAQRARPLERQAQLLANATIRAKMQADPTMDENTKKKVKYQALTEARIRTGADKVLITFEGREWEAVQAGAISDSRLKEILNKADLEQVKKLATPRTQRLMTSTKISRAKQMFASGATQAEVAKALGVSISTLNESLNVGDDE